MNVPFCFFAETQLQFVWRRATVEARFIIFFLAIFSIFAWYMMVSKALQMRRAKKPQPLFRVRISSTKECAWHFRPPFASRRLPDVRGLSGGLRGIGRPAQGRKRRGAQTIHLAQKHGTRQTHLEGAVARESLKLEAGLILLAIAVSGAPFIGCWGRSGASWILCRVARRAGRICPRWPRASRPRDHHRGRFAGGHSVHVRL